MALRPGDKAPNVTLLDQQQSARTGIWRTVATWLTTSFSDVAAEIHSVAEDDDGRVLL